MSTKSSELGDYKGSGYDRGHLVPTGDMKYSDESMRESFFMSNISPQNPDFNRGIWRKLEQLVRDWGREGEIFIQKDSSCCYENLGSIRSNKVTIPSKFYKIVYSSHKNSMIGFLVPNKKSNFKLESFVVEVDSIEKITGINFYEDLPDNMENLLESEINLKKWKFN